MIPGAGALRLILLATIIQNRGMSLALSPVFWLSELDGGGLGPKSNFTQKSLECTTINTGLGYVYVA